MARLSRRTLKYMGQARTKRNFVITSHDEGVPYRKAFQTLQAASKEVQEIQKSYVGDTVSVDDIWGASTLFSKHHALWELYKKDFDFADELDRAFDAAGTFSRSFTTLRAQLQKLHDELRKQLKYLNETYNEGM